MYTFEQLLKDNGIKIPRFFVWYFQKKWKPVEKKYEELVEYWKEREQLWEEMRKYFLENWEKEIPELKAPKLTFKEPDEAIKRISVIMGAKQLYKMKWEFERKIRNEWIEKIIENAPVNCEIRISTDESPKLKELGKIGIHGLYLKDVTFDPENPPSTEWWGMTLKNARVEYLEKQR